MSNCIFGWPNYSDVGVTYTPTFAGGAWQAALPLTNLADRRLAKIARSVTAALADTRFRVDLGTDRVLRVFAVPKHTLSSAGKFRVLARPSTMLPDYEAGDDIAQIGGTFARTGTATYVDAAGVVRASAPGILRDSHYPTIGGARTTLLEAARTNAWTFSEAIDDAAYTKSGVTVTANATSAPDAAVTADKVVGDGANSQHKIIRNTGALTDSLTTTASVFAKAAEKSWIAIKSRDKAGTDRFSFFNASTGANGVVDASHTLRTTALANGWYRLQISFPNATGASTPHVECYVANGGTGISADTSFLLAATDGLYLWGAQLEVDQPFASSYIPTVAATVTRNDDNLYFTYTPVPQEMTIAAKFIELGTVSTDTARLLNIGSGGGGSSQFLLYSNIGVYRGYHQTVAGAVGASVPSAPVIGETVELRSVLSSTGAVQTWQSRNGGAETTQGASAALAFDAAWTAPLRLYLNSQDGSSNFGFAAFQYVRIMAGTQTLATMQASVMDSGWLDAWPSGQTAETLAGLNYPLLYIPAANFTGRYVSWQFSDAANSAAYIDLARLVVAAGWQPTINMADGAQLGLETETSVTVTDGGAKFYNDKPRRRYHAFTLAELPEAEALQTGFNMQRIAGLHGQLFFAYDATDAFAYLRSFLGVPRELGRLEIRAARGTTPYVVVEEL